MQNRKNKKAIVLIGAIIALAAMLLGLCLCLKLFKTAKTPVDSDRSEADADDALQILSAIHEYGNDGGSIYSFVYDDLGRITQINTYYYGEFFENSEIDPIQKTKTFTYDAKGKLEFAKENYTYSENKYNEKGLLEYTLFSSMVCGETYYTYDAYDRLVAEETRVDGFTERIEYTYNEANELAQVSVLSDYGEADTYVAGDACPMDSRALYYYRVQVEQKISFPPFTISEVQSCVAIKDAAGNTIFSLSLSNPTDTTIRYGKLSKIVCDYRTYEFYYSDNTTENADHETIDLSYDFAQIEYAILIRAMQDSGLSNIQWELSDLDSDGASELLLIASGGDWAGPWDDRPLLADADSRMLWFYIPGAAGDARWAYMNSAQKAIIEDDYSTASWYGIWHSEWDGNSWNKIAEHENSGGYNADGDYIFVNNCKWYGKEVSLDEYNQHIEGAGITDMELCSPDLSKIHISGNPDHILAALDKYLTANGYIWAKNTQNANRTTYLIPGAANIWINTPESLAEKLGRSNFDCALTIITADSSKNGVSLTISRTYTH